VLGTVPSDTTRRHETLGIGGAALTLEGDLAAAGTVDNAVLDLAARGAGVSLSLWLGGHHRSRVAVADRLVWADAPAHLAGEARVRGLVERAQARVARHGFTTVSIVAEGAAPPDVIALLGALRQEFGERVRLRLDLIAYPTAAVRPLIGPARELGVTALVEPGVEVSVGPDRTTVPIAVSACPELAGILRAGVAQIVRIAPAQHGGAVVAQRIAAAARVFQAEVLPAGRTGLAIELALLGQLARALPADLQPLDVGPDPAAIEGIAIVDGALSLPDGPGLGVSPDPALLARAERRAEIVA
jgi:glucarate dehydratase